MAHQKRTLTSLHANPQNPRRITSDRLAMLERSLAEFGDLSPIILNIRTGHLLGGHQRTKVLRDKFGDADITITQTYEPATSVGTVREGYVLIDGERFAYREVDFDENRERLANLAANRGAGDFDDDGLKNWLADLAQEDLDLDLSMFDADERSKLLDLEEPKLDDTDHDIQERFDILITCRDEAQQATLLERFQDEGITCKPLLS